MSDLSNFNYKYDGGELQSVAAAKLSGFNLTLANGGQDKLTFVGPNHDILAAPLFAWGKSFELYHQEELWFAGRVNSAPASGTAQREQIAWEIVGPWYYIEHTPYMQSVEHYRQPAGEVPGALETTYQSRCMLGISAVATPAGTHMVTLKNGEVIREILEYCLTVNPGKFLIGQIDPAVTFPVEEGLDLMCSESIRKMMRWSPDAVLSFDYSTTPPTLNVLSPSSLADVSYPVVDKPVSEFSIRRRDDLKPACVAITYELTSQVDNNMYRSNIHDIAPTGFTGRELNALCMTVEVSGMRSTVVSQECGTEFIMPLSLNWWKKRIQWLKDIPDVDCSIAIGASFDYTDKAAIEALGWKLEYEIRIGSVPDWLVQAPPVGGAPVSPFSFFTRDCIVTAKVSYKVRDGAGAIIQTVTEKPLEFRCKVTDLVAPVIPADPPTEGVRDSGTVFSNMLTDEEGEQIPQGLAAAYYAALSTLTYEGLISFHRKECLLADAKPGSRLALTGGLAEWATAKHAVQETVFQLNAGTTQISFGALPGYQFQDLIELQRVNRRRKMALFGFDRGNAKKIGGAAAVKHPPGNGGGDGPDGGPEKDADKTYQYPDSVNPTKEIQLIAGDILPNQVMSTVVESGKNVMKPGWVRFHA